MHINRKCIVEFFDTLIMQDSINNWRTTALILTTILFPAAGIWSIGKS